MGPHSARGLVGFVLTICFVLSGCAGGTSGEEKASLQDLADAAFAGRPGIDRVEVSETIKGDSTSVAMSVVTAPEVPVQQVVEAAELARTFSVENVSNGRWTTHVYVGEPPARFQIEVYPQVQESPGGDVRAVFDAAKLPGVATVSIAAGVPYLTGTSVKELDELIPKLRRHPLWSKGGSLQAGDGQVRIMDEPKRVTTAQLLAIVAAATGHPQGEFWLEASATAERFPQLYINKVTSKEGTAIAHRFGDSAFLPDNKEAYELYFSIRSVGADGVPNDIVGTFGRR